jgi:arginase
LSYREAHLAMEMLADTGRVVCAELVEVNPILDQRNGTAMLAVELLCSLLGKKIL